MSGSNFYESDVSYIFVNQIMKHVLWNYLTFIIWKKRHSFDFKTQDVTYVTYVS